MSKLLIYCHDDQTIDFRLDINGNVDHQTNLLWHELPSNALTTPCILLVNGEHVTLNQIQIPDTSRAKLAKIVPYAIEDQLIESPEALHFAFDKLNEDGLLPIAIVKNAIIQKWMEDINNAGVLTKTMIPDYLALPYEDGAWHIYLTHDRALLRLRANYGMTIALTQLPDFLKLKLQEEFTQPKVIKIDYSEQQHHYDQSLLQTLHPTIIFSENSIEALELFNHGLKQTTVINLMHGDFSQAKPNMQVTRLWRVVRYLLIACCAIWVSASIAEYGIFKYRLHNIETQIKQLYLQAFPNASEIVEPEQRIQQLSQNLHDLHSGGSFLSLLTLAGQQIQNQGSNISLKKMRFTNNNLNVDVQATSFEALEAFSQGLRSKGLMVKQSDARTTKDSIMAHINITRGQQ